MAPNYRMEKRHFNNWLSVLKTLLRGWFVVAGRVREYFFPLPLVAFLPLHSFLRLPVCRLQLPANKVPRFRMYIQGMEIVPLRIFLFDVLPKRFEVGKKLFENP